MTDNKITQDSLECLIENERICREHCLELMANIPPCASKFFQARRNGDTQTALNWQKSTEKAKAEAAERIGHYRMHSDNLLEALNRDLDYIAAEGLKEYRAETMQALIQAQKHRKEILAD